MGVIPERIRAAEMERMMKIQEVILKAMAGKLKWWEAAEIIGGTDRTADCGTTARGARARSVLRWKCWRRYCSYTVRSISISTCSTFTKSSEKNTGSAKATRG